MKKNTILILLIFCYSCSTKTIAPLHIGLADSSRTLKFSGLDAGIIGEINRDTSTRVWQSFIPVYKMPSDTDMKDYQAAQPGKYQVSGDTVSFIPDTPFTKHQTYFVRYYRYGGSNSIWDHIKHQKKLGRPSFTDLIFKP